MQIRTGTKAESLRDKILGWIPHFKLRNSAERKVIVTLAVVFPSEIFL